MNWKNKMAVVLKDVMGPEYDVAIVSEYSFSIMFNGTVIFTRTSKYETCNHWREDISDVMKALFNNKINEAIKKV